VPTVQQARQWLDRWDRQQEYYLPDREERFAVIADVVAESAGREDPLIVDLGAGPGSLSVRLLDRLPTATVVAVDADPLLLGLASAAFDDRPGLRIVRHDLREPGWVAGLGLDRPANAVVSTTALHWLTRPQLAELYRQCGELLEPGGVVVNGDHLHDGPDRPRLDVLTRRIAKDRAARVDLRRTEDWDQWWDAVAVAPELADLRAASDARPTEHSAADIPTYEDHVRYLRNAGFAEVGTVWQHGDDRVLVAVR
jgi:SAM-dependent methyltransferase